MLLHLLDLRGQRDGRAGGGQAGELGRHAFLLLSLEQREKDADTGQPLGQMKRGSQESQSPPTPPPLTLLKK